MSEQSRGKYLIKNTTVFAIGNFGTRLINFFMVPLYTYALSTSDYGMINTYSSICMIIIPLIMCNIGEAIRRYLLDKDLDEYAIRAVEFFWIFFGLIVSMVMFFVLSLVPFTKEFALDISIYTFTNSLASTVFEYLRGKEKMKLYTFCGLLQTLLVATMNIIFLVRLHLGIHGYYLAYILAYVVTAIIAFCGGKQTKGLKKLHYDQVIFRDMSKFSITLVPNSLMWWVAGGSDKLMLTYFVSSAATGIYSIAAKLPTILSTMNTILLQAWQFSAIKEADSEDKVAYNNKMFQFYAATTSIVGAGLLLVNRPFMNIYVVGEEYKSAWLYSPFLIVTSMLATLCTFVGTSYYVEKDMKGNLKSATVGAIVNVGLNAIFIPLTGITGAAMATCACYIAVLIFRTIDTRKYIPIKVITPLTMRLAFVIVYMLCVSFIKSIIGLGLLLIGFILVMFITRIYYIEFVMKILKIIKRK